MVHEGLLLCGLHRHPAWARLGAELAVKLDTKVVFTMKLIAAFAYRTTDSATKFNSTD